MRVIRRDGQAADLVFGLSGLVAVLLTVAVAMFFGLEPSGPVCLWHRLTGLPCPACGTTRALQALLEGRVAEAFRLQPLVLSGGALVAALSVFDVGAVLLFRRVVRVALDARERWAFAGAALLAFAANWIYLLFTLSR